MHQTSSNVLYVPAPDKDILKKGVFWYTEDMKNILIPISLGFAAIYALISTPFGFFVSGIFQPLWFNLIIGVIFFVSFLLAIKNRTKISLALLLLGIILMLFQMYNAVQLDMKKVESNNFLELQNPNSDFYIIYNIATQLGGGACDQITQSEALQGTNNGKPFYTAEELKTICRDAAKESGLSITTPEFEHEIYEYLWEARLHKDPSICDMITNGDTIVDTIGNPYVFTVEELREECKRLYSNTENSDN